MEEAKLCSKGLGSKSNAETVLGCLERSSLDMTVGLESGGGQYIWNAIKKERLKQKSKTSNGPKNLSIIKVGNKNGTSIKVECF